MPLQKQLINLPFGVGVTQHSNDIATEPPGLIAAQNVRVVKSGSWEKRSGTSLAVSGAHPTLPTVASNRGTILPYRDETVLLDGTHAYSYSPVLGKYQYKDKVSDTTVTRTSIGTVAAGTTGCDIAYGNGVVVLVYTDLDEATSLSTLYLTVYDYTTGAEIYSSYPLVTGIQFPTPRVFFVGNTAIITYKDESALTNIYAISLSSTYTLSSSVLLVSDKATRSYAACALLDRFAVGYGFTTGAPNPVLKVRTFDTSFVQIASVTTAEQTNASRFAYAMQGTTGETLWFLYPAAGSETIKAIGFNPSTLATAVSPLTIYTPSGLDSFVTRVTVSRISSSRMVGVVEVITTYAGSAVASTTFSTTGVLIAGANRKTYCASIMSAPFIYNTRAYMWAYVGTTPSISTAPASSVLLDLGVEDTTTAVLPARPVAVAAPRFSVPDNVVIEWRATSSVSPETNVFLSVCKIKKNNAGRTGLALLRTDFNDSGQYSRAYLGEAVRLSGGVPSYYDSALVGELNFLYSPAVVAGAATNVSGGLVAAGTYLYKVCFEHVNTRGEVARSTPSESFSVTVGGGDNAASITVSNLCVTTRQDAEKSFKPPVQLALYRTAVGTTSPFYRVRAESATPANDPTSQFTTITDTYADTSITSGPQLYTEGGVLNNVNPPSASSIVTHKNRAWTIGDDLRTLYFTKQLVEGEEPSFCDEFTITVDSSSDLTALASMDDTLVIFSETGIHVLYGEGPNDLGTGSDYGLPRRLSTNVGCIEPRSALLSDEGLYFQSQLGLYMLSRGLQCGNVGMPIEDTLDANPTITSAIVHPSGSYMMWSAINADTGARLVFMDKDKQWATDDVTMSSTHARIISSCVTNGVYYILDESGNLYQEDPTTNLDVNTWVTAMLETSWMKTGGLQGFQRIWSVSVLGHRYSRYNLKLEVAFDYSSTYTQSHTWLSYTTDQFPIGQYEIRPVQPKCQALRVKITDATPTGGSVGTGKGTSFVGLAIEAGVKQGTNKLSEVQRG